MLYNILTFCRSTLPNVLGFGKDITLFGSLEEQHHSNDYVLKSNLCT